MLNKFKNICALLVLCYIFSYIIYDRYIADKNSDISKKNDLNSAVVNKE
jgi:hypothetical protein